MEQWPDNTVIVSESFDRETAAKLSGAIRSAPTERRADIRPVPELSMRLYALPAFRAFQLQIAEDILNGIEKSAQPQK